jgi:hypothetical protein
VCVISFLCFSVRFSAREKSACFTNINFDLSKTIKHNLSSQETRKDNPARGKCQGKREKDNKKKQEEIIKFLECDKNFQVAEKHLQDLSFSKQQARRKHTNSSASNLFYFHMNEKYCRVS